ncbi:hypothetical protein J1C56_02085 [Aminobacter anthyllidis]|uniref:Uncharacterized protein n=1 Tax=Aminobacter anthyllidis TaxID=1035067 RepID=A0A9X1A6X6_9HYPH|nr:hypothetical protein [Aminobacter anthyllidis]MBT1154374.1 hypothetical protein [Aminobacter anthyllidis]
MASLSAILQLVDLATGESSYGSYANWGEVADFNFSALEDAVGEVTSKTLSSSNVTLTADEERSLLIKLSGTLSANVEVRTNDRKGFWFVTNDTTGDFTVTFKTTSGTGIVVPQAGRAILVSDGTNVLRMMNVGAGGSASRPVYASKSGSYTALQSDDGAIHEYSATATVSFKPAALLGAGWTYVVRANGGIVTLDPNASELVNGATTLAIADGTSAIIVCTGTAFRVIVILSSVGNVNLPASDDGAALGSTSLKWSDLFLASGGVINWASGDVTVTHSSNALAFAGASSGYSFDAALSITGAASATTTVTAGTDMIATSGIYTRATSGTISIRPGGAADTTNAFTIDSSGNATINGTLTVTG